MLQSAGNIENGRLCRAVSWLMIKQQNWRVTLRRDRRDHPSLDGYIAASGDDLGWSRPSDELFQWWLGEERAINGHTGPLKSSSRGRVSAYASSPAKRAEDGRRAVVGPSQFPSHRHRSVAFVRPPTTPARRSGAARTIWPAYWRRRDPCCSTSTGQCAPFFADAEMQLSPARCETG